MINAHSHWVFFQNHSLQMLTYLQNSLKNDLKTCHMGWIPLCHETISDSLQFKTKPGFLAQSV